MMRLSNKSILKVSPYVPGKPIEEVKRELGLKKVIKLASNENPFPPSPKVLAAIRRSALTLNRYPDGDCFYLREYLARQLKVNPRQLIFGNGSDELIILALRAFVKPKDEVIIARPSFMVYSIASKIIGAKVKEIDLVDFRYDLQGMKRAITDKTRIIFLGNPDNPAGTYLTQKQVVDFLKSIRKDILVFMDEAYFEFVLAKDYVDSIALIKKYPNVFVTRTFSKLYGLAGLRIGYGVGALELVDILNRIREPFNVNSTAQQAALACLKDKVYYRKCLRAINEQRTYLYRSLKHLNIDFVNSHTNFILIDVANALRVANELLKCGVIVRDMSIWGLRRYIRVTIGTALENKTFIKQLKKVI